MKYALRMALCVALLNAAPVLAQTYPAHRIQILVPFSAGTVLDTLARVTAEHFSAEFGQPVVILNRPGAAGLIAFGEMAAAQTDGYTLIFAGHSQLTIQPAIKAPAQYRVEDFTPVCQMFETPFALVVGPDSPFQDIQQFVAAARAKPHAIRIGHSGFASVPHIQGALLAKAAGFEAVEVPYRALGDQIKDVIAGEIDAAILSIGSFSAAKVRVIAVLNRRRSATYPHAPTVAEAGYPVPLASLNGLFAHSGSPRAVIERLEAACAKAFVSERFRIMAQRLDVNDELLIGAAFAKRLEEERRAMPALIKSLGLKPE